MASSRNAIEERAARWLQKRDDAGWSVEDDAHLSQWLDADTNHRVAFLRLEAAWGELSRLRAVGAGFPRGRVPSVEELDAALSLPDRAQEGRDGRKSRALSFLWAALAACLIGSIVGGVYYSTHSVRVESYATAVGGLESVPLEDGSNIRLSSATLLHVRLGSAQRRIDLAQGEAFFEVARDASRPFVVNAGSGRAIAVGTGFSVRRDGDRFRVVVIEGTVRVENAVATRLLPAGSIAHVDGNDIVVQTATLSDAESLLSWRSGYVVFHETALADAVAELNRYNQRKIVIGDPRIAAIRLSGRFRSTNIDSFSRLLQQSFPIRAREAPEGIVLSAAQSSTP
jgi:transmembrane sensor